MCDACMAKAYAEAAEFNRRYLEAQANGTLTYDPASGPTGLMGTPGCYVPCEHQPHFAEQELRQ